MRRLLLLAALLPLVAGCATPGAAPEDLTRLTREVTLAPRGVHEFNVEMEAGASLLLSYEATAEVTWDVHSHAGGSVKTAASGRGASGGDAVTAATGGIHSVFFQNFGSAPVNLTFTLEGRFEPVRGG